METYSGPDSKRSPADGTPRGFDLTIAAHRFLLAVVPWRHPDSEEALAIFAHAIRACVPSRLDLEAILLHVLAVLDPHTNGRLPTLIDRYLSVGSSPMDAVDRFCSCVIEIFDYRGLGDRYVERAISIIEACYSDPTLQQRMIATRAHLAPGALCTRFKRRTGLTIMRYLGDVRLDHAATLLITSDLTIKEVWAAVGYNDFSNFDHDFKKRFGTTPSLYRARGVRSTLQTRRLSAGESPQKSDASATPPATVLIVDDDEGTRETIAQYLGLRGYAATTVETAEEALRQIATARPDALLLDYHLPGMDGLTCLRTMRENRLAPGARVVLFSADWDLDTHAAELRALDATHTSKIIDIEQIEALLFPA